MDFSFTEDQLSIQSIARDFAQKRIAPVAAELDAKGEFPLENIREMGQLGLMGIEVPEAVRRRGDGPIAYVLAMIEIAAADAATSTIMSVNNSLFCNGILKHGTEEQKQKYVRAIATGEAIGAYALTEPQSGSDASAMHTRATKNAQGDWVINGKKSWITSGPVARYIVLFAISTPGIGARGVSAFIIDTKLAGLPCRQERAEAGHSRIGDLRDRIPRLRLPEGKPAGRRRQGLLHRDGRARCRPHRYRLAGDRHRPRRVRSDLAVGARPQGVRPPIGTFQMTQSKIADMKCKLDAAMLLTLRAAWQKGEAEKTGGRFGTEAAMAKLTASEAAMWITHQAVQIHGGMGYSKEMPLERYFRDAKITEIYEGTSEIQRMVIARAETGLR
jgi:alkylation response protein AidB-like acyl-CoA dehydrogenase